MAFLLHTGNVHKMPTWYEFILLYTVEENPLLRIPLGTTTFAGFLWISFLYNTLCTESPFRQDQNVLSITLWSLWPLVAWKEQHQTDQLQLRAELSPYSNPPAMDFPLAWPLTLIQLDLPLCGGQMAVLQNHPNFPVNFLCWSAVDYQGLTW